MPAQQGVGSDEEQRLPPGADAAGEQHQERPIGPRYGRALDVAAQHDQLLAQERILGEQLRPSPQQVCPGPRRVRHRRRPRPQARAESAAHSGDDPDQATAAPANESHGRTPH